MLIQKLIRIIPLTIATWLVATACGTDMNEQVGSVEQPISSETVWAVRGCGIDRDTCSVTTCTDHPYTSTLEPTKETSRRSAYGKCPSTRIRFSDGSYLVGDDGRPVDFHPAMVIITETRPFPL